MAVEVAVCVILRGPQILVAYNESWGSFTMPMTKRRAWQMGTNEGHLQFEPWKTAAARAAAELLGQTIRLDGLRDLWTIENYGQSDRDGQWKFYEFHCFALDLAVGIAHHYVPPAEWLSRDELLDPEREPISKTARFLAERLGPCI